MKLPDSAHPLWSTVRFAIVAVVLSLMLIYGYETFSWEKDGRTVLTVLSGLGGFDLLQRMVQNKESKQ